MMNDLVRTGVITQFGEVCKSKEADNLCKICFQMSKCRNNGAIKMCGENGEYSFFLEPECDPMLKFLKEKLDDAETCKQDRYRCGYDDVSLEQKEIDILMEVIIKYQSITGSSISSIK